MRAALAVASLAALTGCAIDYTDDRGVRHVAGLAYITIGPGDPDLVAGDWVEVVTLGAAATRDAAGGGLLLGYGRRTTAAFRDNVIARGPVGPERRSMLMQTGGDQ